MTHFGRHPGTLVGMILFTIQLAMCCSDNSEDGKHDTGTDTDSDSDSDTGTDTDADTGTDSDTGSDSDSDSDSVTDTDADTDTDSDSDTGTDSDADTGTDSDADTGTDSDSDSNTDADTDTGTDGTPDQIFPPGVTDPRILIVGDSVSAGPGCYKGYLLENLQNNGYTHFEFVGPYTDDCGSSVHHGAVSCSTSVNYTEESFTMSNCYQGQYFAGMSTLMAEQDPDLVMIQLGVNDVWEGDVSVVETVLSAYSTLVQQARDHNPNIVVVVAQIHRVITQGGNCAGTVNAAAEQLVQAVPGWAAGENTEDSPIFVADLWTHSSPVNADDCVHPNDTGARIMGEDWYNALKDILPR